MRVLLTGAYGFVGSHIRRLFEAQGIDLTLTSRSDRGEANQWTMDLADAASLDRLDFSGITHVVHCASAIPSRGDGFSSNVKGTTNLLAALSQSPLESFVYVSSVSVYELDPLAETVRFGEDNTHFAESGYGHSKRLSEEALKALTCPVCIFRPSSIYGQGMVPTTVLPALLSHAQSGNTLSLRGSRNYVQNFVSVADVAALVVKACTRASKGDYNVFSDDTVDVGQLAKALCVAAGSSSSIDDHRDDQPWPRIEYPNARVRNEFNHSFVGLAQGLKEMIRE